MNKELYPIPGWPNYFITEEGSVYSEQKGVLIEKKQQNHTGGYKTVSLWLNGKGRSCFVHRLVIITFKGIYSNRKLHVNHIDGNKTNNHLDNLEAVSCSDNLKHSYKIGMHKPGRGEAAGNSKLKIEEVREIRQLLKEGKLSMPKIGALYGVSGDCIFGIKTNIRWQHSF